MSFEILFSRTLYLLLMLTTLSSGQIQTSHIYQNNCISSEDCPPWFHFNQTSQQCLCGDSHHGKIRCNNAQLTSAVRNGYCVTYDTEKNTTSAGVCLCNIFRLTQNAKDEAKYIYFPLPSSVYNVTDAICGSFGRTGQLCGKCKANHSPIAYSYKISCVLCKRGYRNWFKYIAAAFIPLTVFYFLVLFFKINITTSDIRPFVLCSQCLSHNIFVQLLFLVIKDYPNQIWLFKIFTSFYGIWNLDFFRAIWPDICLNVSPLATLALDYAIAVYPVILVIFSYFMIELHDHNFKPVVIIWKPFRYLFTLFRRNWDTRTTVIDAYATFFLLAYMKVLSVSSNLLAPIRVYHLNQHSTYGVLYDGSMEYFGKEHLPYAILATLILSVFALFPTIILFFYPFHWFQKLLNCFPIRWHILHTFVDSFQGCYKDGTEPGERDCRWFAAFFLLLRVALFIIYCLTQSTTYFTAGALYLTFFVVLLVTVQPYKKPLAYKTKIDTVFLLLLVSQHLAFAGFNTAAFINHEAVYAYMIVVVILVLLPLICVSSIIIYLLFSRRKWGREFISRLNAWRQGYTTVIKVDRLENPENYSTYQYL